MSTDHPIFQLSDEEQEGLFLEMFGDDMTPEHKRALMREMGIDRGVEERKRLLLDSASRNEIDGHAESSAISNQLYDRLIPGEEAFAQKSMSIAENTKPLGGADEVFRKFWLQQKIKGTEIGRSAQDIVAEYAQEAIRHGPRYALQGPQYFMGGSAAMGAAISASLLGEDKYDEAFGTKEEREKAATKFDEAWTLSRFGTEEEWQNFAKNNKWVEQSSIMQARSLDQLSDELNSELRASEARMKGREGMVSNTYDWTVGLTLELGAFMLSGLGGPAGLTAYVSAGANELGRDVYRETGDLTQAVFAGTVHTAVTMGLLGAAHKLTPGFTKNLRSIWSGTKKAPSPMFPKLMNDIEAARIHSAARTFASILAIEGVVVSGRMAEQVMNSVVGSLTVAKASQRFEWSGKNFSRVFGEAAAHEGPLFIMIPAVTKGFGIGGSKRGYAEWSNRAQTGSHILNRIVTMWENTDSTGRLKMVETLRNAGNSPLTRVVKQWVEAKYKELYETEKGKEGKEVEKLQEFEELQKRLVDKEGNPVELEEVGRIIDEFINEVAPHIKDGPVEFESSSTSIPEPSTKANNGDTTADITSRNMGKAQENINKETKRAKEKEQGEDVAKPETEGQKKALDEVTLRQDKEYLVLNSILDASGKYAKKLEVELKELNNEIEGIDSTSVNPAKLARKKMLEESLELYREAVQHDPVRHKGTGEFARTYVVGEDAYSPKSALNFLGKMARPGTPKRKKQEALFDYLRENEPGFKEMSNGQIRKALKQLTELPTDSTLRKDKELTAKEFNAAQKEKRDAVALAGRNKAVRIAINKAKQMGTTLLKKIEKQLRDETRDNKARGKDFNKWVRGVRKQVAKINDGAMLDAFNKLVGKQGDTVNGKKEFKSRQEVLDSIDLIQKKIESYAKEQYTNSINDMIGRRTDSPTTRLSPVLDSVVTSIKTLLDKTWKESIGWKESLEAYRNLLARRDMDEISKQMINSDLNTFASLLTKVEKGGLKNLKESELIELNEFIERLHNQNQVGTEIRQAQKEIRARKDSAEITAEIAAQIGIKDAKATDHALVNMVKFFGYGLQEKGRLAEYGEYLSGGTNTTTFRVLVRDVQESLALSRRLEGTLHRAMLATLKDSGLKVDDLVKFTDAVKENEGKSIKFDDIFTTKFNEKGEVVQGPPLELTLGTALGLLVQSKDPTTLALFREGAGLEVGGTKASAPNQIFKLTNTKKDRAHEAAIDKIIETLESNESMNNVAKALVKHYNSDAVVDAVREYGMRKYGHDVIVSGGSWVPRQRIIKSYDKNRDVSKTRDIFDAESLHEGHREHTGIDASMPVMDSSVVKARASTTQHNIFAADPIMQINRFHRSLANLLHLEPAMEHAQSMLKSDVLQKYIESTPLNSINRRLLQGINANFYRMAIRAEMGHMHRHTQWGKSAKFVRNNLLKSGLSWNPAIPTYQALSLFAASYMMGPGGAKYISRATAELFNPVTGFKRYREMRDRGETISGMLWDRIRVGQATSVVAGESTQVKQKDFLAAGELRSEGFTPVRQGGASNIPKNLAKRTVEIGGSVRDFGMKGITAIDRYACVTLFRAIELQAISTFKSQGKKPEGKLFDEYVRLRFEENLNETQPSFHPLFQPHYVNRGAEDVFTSMYSMYQGYSGKLASMQRRAMMRARRSIREGDYSGAARHFAYGAGQTAVGSALIPFFRNAVRLAMVEGGVSIVEAFELFGVEKGEYEQVDEAATYYAIKSSIDAVGQVAGVTGAGAMAAYGLMGTVLPDSFADEFMPASPSGVSPFVSAFTQLPNALDSLFNTEGQAHSAIQLKRIMAVYRTLGGVAGGAPGTPATVVNETLKAILESRNRQYQKHNKRAR